MIIAKINEKDEKVIQNCLEIDNVKNQLDVNFYTTPTDKSGKLIKEKSFSFKHRSN